MATISSLAALSPDERRDYEADVKYTRDRRNQMKYAIEEAISEGLAKGMAQGMAQGENEGIRKVARNMKEQGFSIEQIHSLTGLDAEEIYNL